MKENTQEINQVENQKVDETITLSLSKNVKTIVIDGIRFEMDLDDPDVFKAYWNSRTITMIIQPISKLMLTDYWMTVRMSLILSQVKVLVISYSKDQI